MSEVFELPEEGENKVLLHSCCAPCVGPLMEKMITAGIDLTIFFYNPNIHPKKEYELRKNENIRFAEKHNSCYALRSSSNHIMQFLKGCLISL